MHFRVILACDQKGGIGNSKTLSLPWDRIDASLKHFKTVTTHGRGDFKGVLISGKNNFLSRLPLISCWKQIVVSTSLPPIEGVIIISSLHEALCESVKVDCNHVWVIGGAKLANEALQHWACQGIDLTWIKAIPMAEISLEMVHSRGRMGEADLKVDLRLLKRFERRSAFVERSNGYICTFETFKPLPPIVRSARNPGEEQYLDLVARVLTEGDFRLDRTGDNTWSVWGAMMRFDLQKGFPLLTTKKVPFKCIVNELLCFLKGKTHTTDMKSKIWDGNSTREFLDSRGLTERKVGDLGPIYGFQWRFWGAQYQDSETDYNGQGIDQLCECIRQIKETPTSRRIIMSAWNVGDLRKMCLPPCHIVVQFYVQDGKLSVLFYQRSADLGLGVPFNIASYALLAHIVAEETDLKVGELVHMMGDAHVYVPHKDALNIQLERDPRAFPTLKMTPRALKDYTVDDFQLENYNPYPAIKMKMSV